VAWHGRLYAGLAPNVLRGMSMNVGMLACYDQAKDVIIEYVTKDPDVKKPSLATNILSSAVAGFTSAFFSLPFDMLKSRLQDMKPDAQGKMPYTGLMDCAGTILRKEGILAFWTGFPAYYGRCAPHAMIILVTISGESVSEPMSRCPVAVLSPLAARVVELTRRRVPVSWLGRDQQGLLVTLRQAKVVSPLCPPFIVRPTPTLFFDCQGATHGLRLEAFIFVFFVSSGASVVGRLIVDQHA
jgi:hypothetical protein